MAYLLRVSNSFWKSKGPQSPMKLSGEAQREMPTTDTRVWLLMLCGVVAESFGHEAQPSVVGLWQRGQRVIDSYDSALGFLFPGWQPRCKQALLPAPTATVATVPVP